MMISMKNNPHANAIKQLDIVANLLKKDYPQADRFEQAIEKLKTPDKVLEGEIEITMDDGKKQKFTAFRSQHDNARGPYKGGIRFHPNVTKEEVMALSTWMTWKCSVTGIPYGGGKGGIIVDPKKLSSKELEKLSRAYAKFIANDVGPWKDIPAPDVNTNGQIMAWMIDEYEKIYSQKPEGKSENLLATFTGKPLELGGSQGREEATGLGGVFVLEQLAKKLKVKRNQDLTIAIQGFGNVGYFFALHADRLGFKVVAVSDSRGGVYVKEGLDPIKTLECKQKNGSISECMCSDGKCDHSFGKPISNEELLELDVDVLVPAALENVITDKNAKNIKAKAIIEMANGPITPEADQILSKQAVLLIPDVLANAGGVTVSYFEWAQNLQGYYWTRDEVIAKLQPLMISAFQQMWQAKEKYGIDGRTATYVGAVKRVIDAMMLRGRV